jgi:hypothetical protein
MAKRNRVTLKEFFRRGALPSENQFSDLIDSTLNMIDEGFDKTAEHGLEITPLRDRTSLISFFKSHDRENALWEIKYDSERDTLLVGSPTKTASIALTPEQRVGIGTTAPAWDFEVNGVTASRGRAGTFQTGTIAADGDWHAITPALSGCHALEVVAGVGEKNTGHYALMHAFAVNTYNPRGFLFNFLNLKRRIRYHQSYYRSLRSKLKLRWAPVGDDNQPSRGGGDYWLQLRSNRPYGEKVAVRYHVTQLWFDHFMDDGKA